MQVVRPFSADDIARLGRRQPAVINHVTSVFSCRRSVRGPAVQGSGRSVPYRYLPFCTDPYHFVLSRTLPYPSMPCCTIWSLSYHSVPFRTVPFCTDPYRSIQFRTTQFCWVPLCAFPNHTVPFHSVPSVPLSTVWYR